MRRSTKGTLAGLAAVALLLGGFGTHAAWNAQGTFEGATIQDGELKLTGSGCLDWQLLASDGKTLLGSAADPSSLFLLPGQLLQRHCSFTVSLKGVGTVTANVSTPSFTLPSGLTGAGLSMVTDLAKNGTALSAGSSGVSTTVANGDVISADFTATLDSLASQTVWQNVAGSLNALTVTVTA
jgi:alternate signal-mediated exported protein